MSDDLVAQLMKLLPPLPDGKVEEIPDEWLGQLRDVYLYAKKGRLRELNGARPKGWRGDGLHEWSYLWGKLDALTPGWLLDRFAELSDPDEPAFSPMIVRRAAEAAATDEYVEKLLRARERSPAQA